MHLAWLTMKGVSNLGTTDARKFTELELWSKFSQCVLAGTRKAATLSLCGIDLIQLITPTNAKQHKQITWHCIPKTHTHKQNYKPTLMNM